MRLRSLRLENYRGTAGPRRLAFPARGVTVVEGPNEIGKSSLAEALELLFFHLDSTKRREVLDVQPVDRDVGTEIEAEIETGPYRFTYTKRFFKKAGTVLKVTAPRGETLRGREAHERALEILDETMDLDLWRALCVQQGAAAGQAAVAGAPSLARALDRSAGTETAGARELTLYDAAREEYLRYWTETGRERRSIEEARAGADRASAEAARLRDELAALERDVERSAELQQALTGMRTALARAEHEALWREEEARGLERREEGLQRLDLQDHSARLAEAAARRDLAAREDLVRRLEEARARREHLERQASEREPALREAEAEARLLQERRERDGESERRAALLKDLADRDYDYRRSQLDLEQLRERRGRIAEAEDHAAAAREVLAATAVDEAALQGIRGAHVALIQAQARLDAARAHLRARALSDVDVEIDGAPRHLAGGEEIDRAIAEELRLVVPGVLDLRVAPAADQLRTRDESRRRLEALLAKAGVATVAEAEERAEDRREAERALQESERARRENLRDLTAESMESKIERLGIWDSYPAEREERVREQDLAAVAPPLPADYDTAKEARDATKRAHEAAGAERVAGDRDCEAALLRVRALKEKAAAAGSALRLAREAERKAGIDLRDAREKRADDRLRAGFDEAERKAAAAREALQAERRELESAPPARARQIAAEAREAAAEASGRLRGAEDELRDLAARLAVLGERGMFEALQEAETRKERAGHELRSLLARAAAARLLFETLRERREAARRAYAAPLKDRIAALGREVFGPSFAIELDDRDLTVATRTLDGITLPFASLSVGAREQISILARLAIALLVDETEGVPLIFDDTLGHSDPDRLAAMGRLLARAGERCQILCLTCTPHRFRHVPDAHVLRLPDEAPESGLSVRRRDKNDGLDRARRSASPTEADPA